jgi:hypothetical protein
MTYRREQLLQIQSAARVFQARADDAFSPWGFRAKEPTIGEDPDRYRRRLMIQAKNQLPDNHELRGITVNRLPADALEAYEPQFFKACKDAAFQPDTVSPGEFRQIEKINSENGYKERIFVGPECFVKQMNIPGRRAYFFNQMTKEWFPHPPRR